MRIVAGLTHWRAVATVALPLVLVPVATLAQQAPTTPPAALTTAPSTAPVTLDFPADGVELKVLADIVTRRLGIPILYDETINAKKVVIRVPRDVPESSLMGILQSALKMKQMALVDAEQPGWKQIIVAQNLAAVAKPVGPGVGADSASAVTQVFALKNIDPGRIVELLRPFLTTPGGNLQTVPGQRLIIVSDYAGVVARIAETIGAIDNGAANLETRFVPLRHADAAQVAPLAMQVLNVRDAAQGGAGGAAAGVAAPAVALVPDERRNQIIVLAPRDRVQDAVALLESMDAPLNVQTAVYRLKSISPERLDRVMKNLVGTRSPRAYVSSVDREAGALVVTGSADVHVQIEQMLKDLDAPSPSEQSPIRFYKLKNTKAADVLATIAGLLGEGGGEGFRQEAGPNQKLLPRDGDVLDERDAMGMSTAPRAVGSGVAPQASDAASAITSDNLTSLQTPESMQTVGRVPLTASRFGSQPSGVYAAESPMSGGMPGVTSVRSRDATVTADPNTNSIIVIAPPAVQQTYLDLIKRLDQRRPQVQIECTIVTLDTSKGFQLGVDAINLGGFNSFTTLALSSFGISEVDPETGTLTPVDGQGGTFALLSPGNVDVIMRALATSTRSRLVSAPQLLVNDNGKGTLKSVSQEPFAEILDTNTTQSRTGLGGQKEAGTTIEVEPHISEDDYLQLTYNIELSSFVGAARGDLPPPSQVNRVGSTVTVPDGYTIVVGGLSVKNLRQSVDSVPILGQIPILKYAFSRTSKTNTDTTLFVFIRPVILREDKFQDLKYLSATKREKAGLRDDFPVSHPIAIH